jgi:hypothetical protein
VKNIHPVHSSSIQSSIEVQYISGVLSSAPLDMSSASLYNLFSFMSLPFCAWASFVLSWTLA